MANDQNTVPVPQGATFAPENDAASSAPAAQPAGSVPVPAGASFAPVSQTKSLGTLGPNDFGSVTGNIAIGALKGTLQDADAAAHGLKAAGSAVPMPGHMSPETGAIIPEQGVKAMDAAATPHGGAQQIGSGLEQAAEWAAGDEALTSLAKMQKIPESVLAMAEKYPTMTKILTSQAAKKAERVAVSSAEGGAQGAVHGVAEGKSAHEAEGGAVGGAVGESAVAIGSELAGLAGKRVGIGTSAEEDAMRGFKPGKRNNRFLDDFQRAAPHMQADPAFASANNVKDQVEALDDVRKNWWQQQVQPLVDRNATVPLGGIHIRNSISAQIPESMKKFHPEQAADIEKFANEFMPGQVFNLNIKDAERDLEYFNAQLGATGYWTKPASERAAMLKTNPDVIKASAASDAIRDELYNKLNTLEPGTDMQELKKTYGSLRNVQNELQGRVNVEGRQAPTSLKELVGLTAGIATGGLHGAMAAAVPMIDREANTATRLVKRATAKQAGAEPGAATKVIRGTGKVAEAVVPPGSAAAGEKVGEGAPSGQHALIRTSDGAFHTVPVEYIDHVKQRDPGATVLSEK
jgi:hypothetical protein